VTTVLASKNPRPGKARFVLSDATTATSSVMVDGQAVRSVR
jgi:hypothetical protein